MTKALPILLGALFTVAVSIALGKLLLRGLRVRLYREEEHVLALVSGAACLSGLVLLLAAMRLVWPSVFLAVGVAILAPAIWRRNPGERLPQLPRAWRIFFGVVFAVFAALYFFNAMAPEHSPDGSTYHLTVVEEYRSHHGLVFIPTNMYAHLSQGAEMLFLFAYVFGRHSAAAMVHSAFLFALPLLMLAYARRFGFAKAGVCGSLFVFLSPVVGIDGISAYNDVALATCLFALFYLLEIWDQERTPALLVPIGLLAGFAYAIKYTAFLAVPYAMGYVAWKLLRARQPVAAPLARITACAFLLMAPWMAKNWIFTGNPIAPFFNRLFPNPYVHISFETVYHSQMRRYEGLTSYWAIPREACVRGAVLGGLLGPLFLLAPVSLLSLRQRAGRRLLLATLVFGATYFTNVGTRFLIPCLPFLSLAMALAMSSVRGVAPVLVVFHALASWPANIPRYASRYSWRLSEIPVKAALRREPEDSYLRRRMGAYSIARMIEALTPPGAKVLAFTSPATAYTTREVLVGYQGGLNNTADNILWTPVHDGWLPAGRLRFRFPAEVLEGVRVAYNGPGTPDDWTVSEFRVFDGERELAREAQWRLRARPNPWDVQFAFDNSPVTRWRSWQPQAPGAFLEVDFRGPQKVDTVVLECGRDQLGIVLRLEGRLASGEWKMLNDDPERFEVSAPAGLRRGAVEEVKALGIHYLLIQDSDVIARHFQGTARLWGVTLLGEQSGGRLYRLE